MPAPWRVLIQVSWVSLLSDAREMPGGEIGRRLGECPDERGVLTLLECVLIKDYLESILNEMQCED